ncbi:WG repeat-containing protein [Winogradskyella undariae]|uniref:WG repeat-containing protein n=1 Tax=Winogradskyella undariae TaxID=1285465 RepID=UPI00156B7E73|nr:WG repeat-containing protein [Winogradskyella undariae]NRR92562.1 WG repeat-containing protein [Winogradskyella undariae]
MRILKKILAKIKRSKIIPENSDEEVLFESKNTYEFSKTKLRLVHKGLKEYYPYSFDELEQSLKSETDLDDTLNYWIEVVKTFDKLKLEPRNKHKVWYEILSNAHGEIQKERKQIVPNLWLFNNIINIKLKRFLKERSSHNSFEIRKVELTTNQRMKSYDNGNKAFCKITSNSFQIRPTRYNYEPIKKLITGQTYDVFQAKFMKCGAIISSNSFLIEPLFSHIHYYTRHNVFCALIEQTNKKDCKKYYFDIKGNLILESFGGYDRKQLPEVGINYNSPKENNIVKISTELIDRDYNKVFSSSYYTNGNSYNQIGIIDNKNNQILPKEYGNFIVFEKEKTILASKDDKIYLFELNRVDLFKTLDCNIFIDDNNYYKEEEISPYTRVINNMHNKPKNEIYKKWGLIDANGKFKLPLEYDYLEKCGNSKFFRTFKAPALKVNHHNWIDDEAELFSYNNTEESHKWWFDYENNSYTSNLYVISSWKGNYLGLVDINNIIIIPQKYSWIKFISSDLLIISIDSEVINYFDKDNNGEKTYVMGGKFGVIDISNTLIVPIEYHVITLKENKIYAQKTSCDYFDENEPHDIYDLNGNKLK